MARNVVLLIADHWQFPPAVFLATRLASMKAGRDVDIVLATNAPASLAAAREFRPAFDLLDVANLHAELRLPKVAHFTRATFLSVFVPRLLQERYERLLYLDVDTYPESNRIFDLFDLEMDGATLAAVRDYNIPYIPNPGNVAELVQTLGIGREQWLGSKYLNSGLLLFDLAAYGESRFEKKALRIVRDGVMPLNYADQTIFNAIVRGKWVELSPAFNMVSNVWTTFVRDVCPPVLVHFAGGTKPWHRGFTLDHPMVRELGEFLKRTPWSDFLAEVNPPPTLANLARAAAATGESPRAEPWPHEIRAAVVRTLAETAFADVDQSITTLNRAALPGFG
jgi:lipopolysaccharide biosynthesis glycosyltransferase